MADEPGGSPMSTTLRSGEALLLVVVLLVALLVVDQRSEGRYERLSVEVGSSGGWVGPGAGEADPQLCYLLGVVVEGRDAAAQVAALERAVGSGSDCAAFASRGANGLAFDPPEPGGVQ